MEHLSAITRDSTCAPGVRFTIVRMSFGRRLDLMRRIRELAGQAEFAAAGEKPADKLEAAMLEGEIERTYLQWGLIRVEGLTVDGETATPASLLSQGPEALCREIVAAIKAECGLSEEERKNS